jgi:AbiEi antitoxin C-terminal domain
MSARAAALPVALARHPLPVLRPSDTADVYAQPGPEFRRLTAAGLLRPLTTGYYARVPQHRAGDASWRPSLHAAALGIAQADYGVDGAALMHVSAARQLGAIPREFAVAVVAVPKQRPNRPVLDGMVVFVKRDIATLDLQRTRTDLGDGWVTTAEQTLLDIAHRPRLAIDDDRMINEALRTLASTANWTLVEELAERQRKRAAAARVRRLTSHA